MTMWTSCWTLARLRSFKQLSEVRVGFFTDLLAHRVMRLLQSAKRLRKRQVRPLHDDRRLHVPLRALEERVGGVVIDAGDQDDNATSAILQLLGSRLHIDHQVPVGL